MINKDFFTSDAFKTMIDALAEQYGPIESFSVCYEHGVPDDDTGGSGEEETLIIEEYPEDLNYKQCPRCADLDRESWHPIDQFYKSRGMSGKMMPHCRQCDYEKQVERRNQHMAVPKRSMRSQRLAQGQETPAMRRASYQKVLRDRTLARRIIMTAILTWIIKTPYMLSVLPMVWKTLEESLYGRRVARLTGVTLS